MAASSKPVGYECEFVDQVPEDYFCKQCKHVAREPTIASCCIEVFCKACIEAIVQDKKPCPSCEKTEFSYIPHNKYQPKILALTIHCSLKARGCEWTGQLQLLDAHLDLTTGDCVYIDVDCPSKCDQKVQKHNVDTHLADHCPNRDYTCPHCSFNATFHEVSEHFEVCRYYPLVCPNRCGASFERDVLEDHVKMCGLQKVQCEFSYTGCEAEFIRDQQKEHMEQNTQKHLALVAAATLRISQTFEQKFQEQQKEFEQKLEDKDSEIKAIVNNEASQLVNEQRRQSDEQIRALQEKLQEQQQSLEESKKQQRVFEQKLDKQREEFQKQQKMFEQKMEEKDQHIKALEKQQKSIANSLCLLLPYEFTITNCLDLQARDSGKSSPTMYTHPGGYKFKLSIFPNGIKDGRGTHVSLTTWLCKGNHDENLKFPVQFTVTLQLLNQHRDQDHCTSDIQCEAMTRVRTMSNCGERITFFSQAALQWNEDQQTQYLKDNSLMFRVTKVVLQ